MMSSSRTHTLAAASVVTAAVLISLLDPALAQGGGDISAGVRAGFQWALSAVKVAAGLIILGCFIMFATGHFRWAAGIGMLVGILGAAKADLIATYFMGL